MADKNSILSGFLIDGKYRFGRYVFFVIIGVVIISNIVFVAYMDCATQLGNRIYLLCLSSCICYAIAMLVNYHYLISEVFAEREICALFHSDIHNCLFITDSVHCARVLCT